MGRIQDTQEVASQDEGSDFFQGARAEQAMNLMQRVPVERREAGLAAGGVGGDELGIRKRELPRRAIRS